MQIKAPPNFQPQDVRKGKTQIPGPVRSRYRKFDIYRDVQQFYHVDDHAIQVAQNDHETFIDLVWHLVYSQNYQSDLEKARAIFRWMTSKNMYTIKFKGNAASGSPEEVILSFRDKQGTYARIFETICRFSGLHCQVLTGFAKGLDYRPGDKFKGSEYNHSWNAILIDGQWYLIDSHWATRYLVSEKNNPENLVYEYDDFYFLTDPEQLIYSHWAHKSDWQLLSRPISLQDFENLPLVKSYFFKCGMFFISHHNGVVQTKQGRVALTLGFSKPTNFTYKIVFSDTNDEMYQGQKLKSYALQHQGKNQTTTFIFRAPKSGQFYFTIFAQLLTGELGVKNVFTASAEYKVIVDKPASDAVALPNCSDSSWGAGIAVDQIGLVANPTNGVLTTSNGKVNLEFKKTRPAFILAKLRKNGMREEDLEKHISEQDLGDRIIVSAELPKEGEYGIEIYGNDPAKDGDTYTHVAQYYVHSAPQAEQLKAFYQESPERRNLSPQQQAEIEGGYRPDSSSVKIIPVDFSTRFNPRVSDAVKRGSHGKSTSCSDGTINRGLVCYRLCTLKIPQQSEIEKEQANAAVLAKFLSLYPAWRYLSSLAYIVSKSDHNSFRDLVWDLIYSKNITNEIEKVRVIFRWLATKNLKEMNFDNVQPGSPEEVLMGLKTGKTTYAMVFDTMCNYAGLHSKIITGYAKGADYKPGMKFKPGTNQHSWNAVYIYGTWCLIDAHWAARRIIGKQAQTQSSEEFHYQLDEYFFLPDPHQLIYTHFPDEAKWQLIEQPKTLEEFENLPHMKPQFFKYHLEFVTHKTSVIYSRGEINIRLRYFDLKSAVTFNFTICFENGEEEYRGVKLNRYGMQESVGNISSFRLRLPIKGSYILYIYAKEDTPENKDNVYAQVCEYKIVQEEALNPAPEAFPPCSYLNWGPGPSFNRYGLTTYQQTACIHTREGKAEVQIKIPQNMQFMGKMKNNHYNDGDLEGYVVHRVVGNTAFFNVTAPGRGEYGLEIYANDPVKEGSTLYHVAQYLIICNEDVKATPLPKLPPGYLGPQHKFAEFGMATSSHHDPIIHLDTNTVTIQIRSETLLRVTGNLLAVQEDTSEVEHPEYIFAHTLGSMITFIINLPHTGFYKLQLYACPVSDSSQQLPGVYNYLINCRQVTQAVFPFPKQYAQWKEGCFMYEPGVIATTTGPNGQQISKDRLPPEVNFRLMIPKAEAVAVVAGEDWTQLDRLQGNEWGGILKVDKYYGTNTKITVNANYGADKTSYATLLEYCV
ncbi:hypothetical protein LOTGIDRAFT_218011 [Lottia gigantea]|uniref:Transglutaminase-like domain-containing protein n=1 Tax=Lottia gigantea TaxID=225164 RepID=V3ZGG5_LOTGI|nr:hypothetical protein LOTGIDRAFT_218011 [Lottia gigantea]ESO90318.1 hypothetical protein LOTGIDRAFT_218011 [Lottia gigantea]